ncbi:MAG: DivIVA domain-containing protein [Acidaminococcales bacterium]|jgi:cell division initiation protein|nr:DivIVA domain-containing protein [Acidaminococcales bacterium]
MSKPFVVVGKKFNKEFRGYSSAEVDNHLQNAQKYIDELYSENTRLTETAADAQSKLEQYQQMEKTMQSTLFVAQETAEEIKVSAQKEKELILDEARESARQTVSGAEAEAARLKARLQADLEEAREEHARVKLRTEQIIEKTRGLLEDGLKLLNGNALAQETAEESVAKAVLAEAADKEANGGQTAGQEAAVPGPETLPATDLAALPEVEPSSEESGEQAEIRKRMEEVLRQSKEIKELLKKKSKVSS